MVGVGVEMSGQQFRRREHIIVQKEQQPTSRHRDAPIAGRAWPLGRPDQPVQPIGRLQCSQQANRLGHLSVNGHNDLVA